MPLRQQNFTIKQDNLAKAIDVDDNVGRSVPTNMNFTDEGFLTKDTGYIPHGSTPVARRHSQFIYKKKNGDIYDIVACGTKLQIYSVTDRDYFDIVISPTFTEGAEFAYKVYGDTLYLCNAVESLYAFTGVAFTEYASAPKGNIMEIFEDRLCIAGVTAEPRTVYYSNVGVPQTFTPADILQPLGVDAITSLHNYYGNLLIFKEVSIWKMTFVYDQVATAFVPKLERQSENYGACSRKATCWVENDIRFFTGREVRSIGYRDQVTGTLGVDQSVISDAIKETLALIDPENYSQVVTFYHNRRYHLTVPINGATPDTTFVNHVLYNNAWTKYVGRAKATVGGACVNGDTIFTDKLASPYGIIKWSVEEEDTEDLNAYLIAN